MNGDAHTTTTGVPDPRHIADYLEAQGWVRAEQEWRGAQVWSQPGGPSDEILLPPRIQYRDDRELLVRALRTMAAAEGRDYNDLVRAVSHPLVDTQYFHTHPDSPSGTVPLLSGIGALEGIRGAFTLAAQAVLDEGPRLGRGRNTKAVDSFLRRVRLGPSKAGSYILSAEVPLSPPRMDLFTSDPPRERIVVRTMRKAIAAAARATKESENDRGNLIPFDDAMHSGVSARLCESLAKFGGHEHQNEFSILFTWSPSHPEDDSEENNNLSFSPHAASILQRAGERLRELEYTGTVRLSGTIIATERQSPQHDGFVKVRGLLASGEWSRERTVLVRLQPEAYGAALAAHARGDTFEAEGRLSNVDNRRELLPSSATIAGRPLEI